MVPHSRKPEPAPERPHWFRVDLSEPMRAALLKIMATRSVDSTNRAIIEALELAERIDTPFTPPVDWAAVERLAARGYSLADQAFDGFNGRALPEPEGKGSE